jgi:hypothetical protein
MRSRRYRRHRRGSAPGCAASCSGRVARSERGDRGLRALRRRAPGLDGGLRRRGLHPSAEHLLRPHRHGPRPSRAVVHRDPAPPGTPTRRARTPRMGHRAEHRAPTTDCLAAPFSQDGPLPELGHAAAPTACGTGAASQTDVLRCTGETTGKRKNARLPSFDASKLCGPRADPSVTQRERSLGSDTAQQAVGRVVLESVKGRSGQSRPRSAETVPAEPGRMTATRRGAPSA